jgi:hypothetical protein
MNFDSLRIRRSFHLNSIMNRLAYPYAFRA